MTHLTVAVVNVLAAPEDPELRARLGPELADHLRHVLRNRALAWARRAGDGREPLEIVAGDGLAERLADVDGPVLLAAPDVPGLGDHHVVAAREDLAAGALVTSGPASDGTSFVIGLARVDPRLLEVIAEPFDVLHAAGRELGGDLGFLRPERRLATLADARAVLADPIAPPELRALLSVLR